MALRRRRLLYAFAAAAAIALLYGLRWNDWNALSPLNVPDHVPPPDQSVSHQNDYQAARSDDLTAQGGQATHQVKPSPATFQLHPLSSLFSLPSPNPAAIPKIQHDFLPETRAAKDLREGRLASIKEAFVHSWSGYRRNAWLKDELAPITGGHRTTLSGWGATLVDSLDALWIMGMKDEFEEAVESIAKINFDTPANLPINVFETTIRYLGGLLGAYDVSNGKYPVLLKQAVELGEMLYVAFDTPNRMPVTRWSKIGVEVAAGDTLASELGSLSLEFTRLSQLTGDPKFYDAVQRITDCFDSQQMQTRVPGLFPHIVNARECDFTQDVTFSIGGSADSVYEYLPKEHQLLGGATEQHRKLYEKAIGPMKEFVLFRPLTSTNADILLAGTLKAFRRGSVELIPQMQHLACFAGGMFALGSKIFNLPDDLDTARRLVDGCIRAYNSTATGIMPDLFNVVACPDSDPLCSWDEEAWGTDMLLRNSNDEDPKDKLLPMAERLKQKAKRLRLPKGMSAIGSREYKLRPEAIESIFVLYRITGDERLREDAWRMYEAIVNQTRTDLAFSTIEDVTMTDSRKVDKMESFWLAETLKYFYLLYEDPGVISLDDYVFNTEAHPFRLQKGDTVVS